MDTIIERDSGASAVTLTLGILAIAVVGGLALYFMRIYPFNAAAQQPGTKIEIQLPIQPPPSSPSN